MTFKEFSNWANARACDGQWGLLHILETVEIFADMRKVKFFKKRFWKENCEKRAIKIVESVDQIVKELKGEQR